MGMVRMFHIVCDICYEQVDGDEWFASLAEQRARDEGYVKRGNKWVCPGCREES